MKRTLEINNAYATNNNKTTITTKLGTKINITPNSYLFTEHVGYYSIFVYDTDKIIPIYIVKNKSNIQSIHTRIQKEMGAKFSVIDVVNNDVIYCETVMI